MYNPVPVSRDFVGTSGTWQEVIHTFSLVLSISLVAFFLLLLYYVYVNTYKMFVVDLWRKNVEKEVTV